MFDAPHGAYFNPKQNASDFINVPGTIFAPTFAPDIDASDFDAAAKVIFQLADFIDDVALPLESAKEIARRDMVERFVTQTAPNGRAWQELNEKYLEWKEEEHGDLPILTLTSALRDSATDEEAWSVSGDSVWFSTDGLPDYWPAHQYGSAHMLQGEGNPSDLSFTDRHGEFVELFQGIPPRPFIGLSGEAESEILAMLDTWVASGMTMAEEDFRMGSRIMSGSQTGTIVGTKGKQYMVAGKGFGGRFGPKIL